MSIPALPEGAFLTSINGRRCTAVPREGAPNLVSSISQAPPTPSAPEPQIPSQDPPQGDPFSAEEPPQRETPSAESPNRSPEGDNPQPQPSNPAASRIFSSLPSEQPTPDPIAPIRTRLLPPQASQDQEPVAPSPDAAPPPPGEEPVLRETAVDLSAVGPGQTPGFLFGPTASPPSRESQRLVVPESGPSQEESRLNNGNENFPIRGDASDRSRTQSDLEGATPTTDEGSTLATTPVGPQSERQGDGADPVASGAPPLNRESKQRDGDGSSDVPTAVIAGSVVGSVAMLSMLTLLLWFWRKHRGRRRRSTLLTPLTTDDSPMRKQQRRFFDQGSISSTPKLAKLRAVFSHKSGRAGGFGDAGTDGGLSPFSNMGRRPIANLPDHTRGNFADSHHGEAANSKMTAKRFMHLWYRLPTHGFLNWRLRKEKDLEPEPAVTAAERDFKEKPEVVKQADHADFSPLEGMDEKQISRYVAQSKPPSRQKIDSKGSLEHFLDGLGFSDWNPFSDQNAGASSGATIAMTGANPFADAQAIAIPVTGVHPATKRLTDVRRSQDDTRKKEEHRPASGQAPHSPRYDSVYRDSGDSISSFATRRDKFRSDPFDLERPELLGQRAGPGSPPGKVGLPGGPKKPGIAHTRDGSFTSRHSRPGSPRVPISTIVDGRYGPNSEWPSGAPSGTTSGVSNETTGGVGKAL